MMLPIPLTGLRIPLWAVLLLLVVSVWLHWEIYKADPLDTTHPFRSRYKPPVVATDLPFIGEEDDDHD